LIASVAAADTSATTFILLYHSRQHIYNSFQSMECCLLPYPGPRVAEDPSFRGSAADLGLYITTTFVVVIENWLIFVCNFQIHGFEFIWKMW
jgi:hypothetical protein